MPVLPNYSKRYLIARLLTRLFAADREQLAELEIDVTAGDLPE